MKKIILFQLLTVLTQTAFCQADSLIFINVSESRIANDVNAAIYNGQEHTGYSSLIEGIPYYESKEWQTGTLVFQNLFYKDVFLKYDLVADQLVVRHPNGITGIVLFTRRIQSFTLGNKHFVNLDTDKESELKSGIYEELVNGRMSLYAKRSKLFEENIVLNELERKFIDKNVLYVLKDGHYYAVKKQKTIMKLIADKRNAVTSAMKASKIKFKSNPELALIKMVEVYNQLSY